MTSVTVTIAGGDRDCSSAVGDCLEAVGLLPPDTYIWTGNERGLLRTASYIQVPLSYVTQRRGDVLWREGHTEMYLGGGMQGGARIDESGGVHGYVPGDQTGNEIGRSPFDIEYWRWESAWRYAGTRTLSGIPMDEATAQVMDHLIDHPVHGYSQDNREGDGTVERITLTWGGTPSALLDVDGWCGLKTVNRWQVAMRTPTDSVITGQYSPNKRWYPRITAVRYDQGTGSTLVRAVQRVLDIDPDGVMGYDFTGALQAYLKRRGYDIGYYGVDHDFGHDSVCALQQSLNDGMWDQ